MTLRASRNSRVPAVESKAVVVELAFDLLCPWSYVMKRRLERVIDQLDKPIQLTFRGFEMNPGMPNAGMPRTIYDRARCGNQSGTKRDLKSLCDAGRALGLDFDYQRLTVAPNTNMSLQMLHFAEQSGQESAALEALFEAYYGQGLNISHRHILLDLGEKIGLSRTRLETHLAGLFSQRHVAKERKWLKEAGVRRVPAVFIGGALLSQGPVDESELRRMLEDSILTLKGRKKSPEPPPQACDLAE